MIKRKVIAEGILLKQDNGRYAINGDFQVTSGMVVEVEDGFKWVETSVEWNGDYYFVKLPDKSMRDARVRLRDF